MIENLIFWVVACIIFTLIEAVTQQFVSLWFLVGSLAALLASVLNVSNEAQFLVFVFVSLITLFVLRPILKKAMQGKIEYTNSDRNVHEMAIVTKSFDASTHEGRILVNNMDWAARSIDGICFQKGDRVIVEKIEGVTCLVKKI